MALLDHIPYLETAKRHRPWPRVTVADATHESFSDLEVLTKDSVRHRQQLALIRDYVRAFFDRNLKGVNHQGWGMPYVRSARATHLHGGATPSDGALSSARTAPLPPCNLHQV